ncbi:hypothetical protein BIFDEN_01942 [Bifidobacterium dentium ATCC 27678]|nr:hypothetical protein BIFDEN_01942 [Bifidobacterium dentium ATCC 27678]
MQPREERCRENWELASTLLDKLGDDVHCTARKLGISFYPS